MKNTNKEFRSKEEEFIIEGVPASPGITIGPCMLYRETSWEPEPRFISDKEIKQQIKHFRQAVKKVLFSLKENHKRTGEQYGKELAEVLSMQIQVLEDRIFLKEVEDAIELSAYDAAYATFVIFRKKKEDFLNMANEYFRERALDIQALKRMLIRNIQGKKELISLKKSAIIIAENLSPNNTVRLHEQKLLGLAMNKGGKTSHTAIVARSLKVPAVVGLVNITEMVNSNDTIILDGSKGKVIVNPKPDTIAVYREKQRVRSNIEQQLMKETTLETQTKDGNPVHVHANLEFEDKLSQILRVEPEGVGLFRTEGIFLNRGHLPSEQEQYKIYSQVAKKLYPRKLIIRTLDMGGDKVLPGVSGPSEANPFLGWRAIRFWLDYETGFLAQLKAILRANTRGNIRILLPMVSGLEEVQKVKKLLDKARNMLRAEGKSFRSEIKLGIMIEIPSAVMLAELFAKEVDFFSVGTNDLVQYTLAVDRGNEKVAKFYSHFHPSILRMLEMTLEAGKAAGIPVGICGEMAGDPMAIPILLAIGFECLSMTHTAIPGIKKIIRELALTECQVLYQQIEKENTAEEIRELAKKFFKKKFPEMYPTYTSS